MERREFLGFAATGAMTLALAGCATEQATQQTEASGKQEAHGLPDASPNPDDQFGIDANINVETVDDYLGLDDVAYRDMRLLRDPADYAAIGGNSDLDITIEGFKITPLPYIATLPQLPVDGAYTGDTLFDVKWNEDGSSIVSATPNYEQSQQIIEELFPQDKRIFLMCGGGGYAGMMRTLLVFLGWDEKKVYNLGGAWGYTGYRALELISYDADGKPTYFLWRADSVIIDFAQYAPLR